MKPPIAWVRTAAAAGVLLLLAFGAVAVWGASRALHLAAVGVRSEHEIHFIYTVLTLCYRQENEHATNHNLRAPCVRL
jgi:hypothetical protein